LASPVHFAAAGGSPGARSGLKSNGAGVMAGVSLVFR
jgi:hypothetical protein